MDIVSYNQGTTAKAKVSEVDTNLSEVDNTLDMDKELSTDQSAALDSLGGLTMPLLGSVQAGEVVALNASNQVIKVTGSNIDNWIGIASEAKTDEDVPLVTLGSIDSNQAGLTIGSEYFVDTDATVTTTDTGFPIGKALSVTEIIIEE